MRSLVVANPHPTSSTRSPLREPQRRSNPQFTSSKYWYGAFSSILQLGGERERTLHTDIGVDVVELRETTEQLQARSGDGFAHGRDVGAVLEVVHRIAVREAHRTRVGDRRAIDEADAFDL